MMHILLYCFLVCSIPSLVLSQWSKDTAGFPLMRLTLSYGMTSDNAAQANLDYHFFANEVSTNGAPLNTNQFTQRDEILQKLDNFQASFLIRPLADQKSIILRVGRMFDAYQYFTTMEYDRGNSSPPGIMTAAITKRYTVYPISIGFGISTPKPLIEVMAELIYAFAVMKEEQTVTTSDGATIVLPARTYRSESVGFRLGLQLNVYITKSIAVVMDGGYRGLGFYQFSNTITGKQIGLDYTTSGSFLNGGISYGW